MSFSVYRCLLYDGISFDVVIRTANFLYGKINRVFLAVLECVQTDPGAEVPRKLRSLRGQRRNVQSSVIGHYSGSDCVFTLTWCVSERGPGVLIHAMDIYATDDNSDSSSSTVHAVVCWFFLNTVRTRCRQNLTLFRSLRPIPLRKRTGETTSVVLFC